MRNRMKQAVEILDIVSICSQLNWDKLITKLTYCQFYFKYHILVLMSSTPWRATAASRLLALSACSAMG